MRAYKGGGKGLWRLQNGTFRPLSALEPYYERDGARNSVDNHGDPAAHRTHGRRPSENVAQPDPDQPHRKHRHNHREFRVVERAQRVRQAKARR